jgi:drug/metabolite transporter (DMT)-like permease
MFKEEITRKKVIAIASAFLGCILVASSGNFNGTLSYVGLMYGLCAGFGYALYSIFSRFAIIRGYHPMTITLYTFVFATLGSVPLVQYSEIRNLFTMQPTETMGNFLFLALIATLIPYILFTMGLSWIENSRAAVIVSVEPIVATVLGVLLFREVPTVSNIVGMVLIITAIIILNTKFVPALSKSHSKQ